MIKLTPRRSARGTREDSTAVMAVVAVVNTLFPDPAEGIENDYFDPALALNWSGLWVSRNLRAGSGLRVVASCKVIR